MRKIHTIVTNVSDKRWRKTRDEKQKVHNFLFYIKKPTCRITTGRSLFRLFYFRVLLNLTRDLLRLLLPPLS